jgi:hypothetical protein
MRQSTPQVSRITDSNDRLRILLREFFKFQPVPGIFFLRKRWAQREKEHRKDRQGRKEETEIISF